MRLKVATMMVLLILAIGIATDATIQWRHNISTQDGLNLKISSLMRSLSSLPQAQTEKVAVPKSIYPYVTNGNSLLINYDNFGFMPNIAVVPLGTTIEIENTTNEGGMNFMQIPTQTVQNPELNIGIINKGQTKSFKLTKPGTWIYENSWETTDMGQITVQ